MLLLSLLAASPAAALADVRRPAAPAATTVAPPLPPPAAWVLVDADNGDVLDAGNDHTPLPPASLTKVITALAAVGSLPPGGVSVPVSARAAAMPAAKISMKQGEVWTLDDTLHALLLSSANDAAVALAERAGATVEGFQRIFAATAANLGMADHPVLNDPAGLDGPDGVEGGNLVSARDLAMAARALLAQATLAAIVATPIYLFTGPDGFHHRLTNHNYSFLVGYPGAIGMKTGYTARAGHCLIAAARRDGRTLIAVVLRSANPQRAAEELLDKGFATPVAAEPTADRLPPPGSVTPTAVRSPARAPVAAAATTAPRRPAPATAPSRHRRGLWWGWPALLMVLAVLALTGLRLRARLRSRRRRQTRAARSDGAQPSPVSPEPVSQGR